VEQQVRMVKLDKMVKQVLMERQGKEAKMA
jgi:hypothetical protein